MIIETDTIMLPAHWASALINGDYSGLDIYESLRCSKEIQNLAAGGWNVVDCEEESHFTWSYRLYDAGADCEGGIVMDYNIIRFVNS